MAEAALRQLQLDVLHIIPTGQAWHKQRPLTPVQHRLAMTQLAFAAMDRVKVDPRETLREGPSYTVETLLELRNEYPAAQLFLIVGEDQAQALPTWYRWAEITKLAIICVAARAVPMGTGGIIIQQFLAQPGFQRLDMPLVDVSATDIRRQLATQQSVAPLVLEPVARYIDYHLLYRSA